jgi:hypothetical protein
MKRTLASMIFAALAVARPASAAPFDNWAALVVAGDYRSADGMPTAAFDNARRELVKGLETLGFAAKNIQQYSARPEADPMTMPLESDRREIETRFRTLTTQATGGCFLYFTSHGVPLGIRIGDAMVGVRPIADIIDSACPNRPTVIVMSACYSGMFIPVLRGDNRMILTAARADRTSFGCGTDNQYTYFDQCVLESLPKAPDFPGLAREAQACVASREAAEGVMPASEPQLYLGASATSLLPPLSPQMN